MGFYLMIGSMLLGLFRFEDREFFSSKGEKV